MVEPTGDPTTLKKEERAMRPTPEVVRKWSSIQQAATGCTGIYQLMPQVEIFVHSMDLHCRELIFHTRPRTHFYRQCSAVQCSAVPCSAVRPPKPTVQCTAQITIAYFNSYSKILIWYPGNPG
jgi:hypothetical protein